MLHKEDRTASVRMSVVLNNEILDSYFRELKCIIDKHKLLDKPETFTMLIKLGFLLTIELLVFYFSKEGTKESSIRDFK